jgi:hypothetical protein
MVNPKSDWKARIPGDLNPKSSSQPVSFLWAHLRGRLFNIRVEPIISSQENGTFQEAQFVSIDRRASIQWHRPTGTTHPGSNEGK